MIVFSAMNQDNVLPFKGAWQLNCPSKRIVIWLIYHYSLGISTYLGRYSINISFESSVLIKNGQNKDKKELLVGGVFVEIGLEPNAGLVAGLIKLNPKGEVPISCACETTVPGLYAAGDVTDIPEKQVLIAAGEGAKAALQAHRYLQRLTA